MNHTENTFCLTILTIETAALAAAFLIPSTGDKNTGFQQTFGSSAGQVANPGQIINTCGRGENHQQVGRDDQDGPLQHRGTGDPEKQEKTENPEGNTTLEPKWLRNGSLERAIEKWQGTIRDRQWEMLELIALHNPLYICW